MQEKKNPPKNEKKIETEKIFFFLCGNIMHGMWENCKFIVRIWEYKELKIKEDKGIEEG